MFLITILTLTNLAFADEKSNESAKDSEHEEESHVKKARITKTITTKNTTT